MADPEPPAEPETPPGVPVWPGLPSNRKDYIIRLNALNNCLHNLFNGGRAKTGTPEYFLQLCIQELHMNTVVLFTIIANMLDIGFAAYDWEDWAKDMNPESKEASDGLAESVMEGIDELIGKW